LSLETIHHDEHEQHLAELLARLAAMPRELDAVHRRLIAELCGVLDSSSGIAHFSRNLEQASEAITFASTGPSIDCERKCHDCTSRLAMAAWEGELVGSAVRRSAADLAGSVITRFGVAPALPECLHDSRPDEAGSCGASVAFAYSLFYAARADGVGIGAISLYRDALRPYSREECRRLNDFHSRLGWLYESAMSATANPNHPAGAPLQPRLLKVLEELLSGHSEKQVAAKLNYSPHTIHTYVKAIYKHYEVSSRSELLARILGTR
jgi:DNA-binding CsgD family transcriptional regulator